MSRIRVKGFKIFFDRHGKLRCYHRATKIAVDLEKAPLGSAHFFAECARIAALTTAMGAPKPGTLGLLISEYRANTAFTDLEPRTRQDYQRVLDYLKPIDRTALVNFNRASWFAFATELRSSMAVVLRTMSRRHCRSCSDGASNAIT